MNPRLQRVCHLGKYYPPAPGGIETHVQTLARAQADMGLHVRVLCVNHDDSKSEDSLEHDGGVEIIRMARRFALPGLDVCPRLPSHLRQVTDYDLIHLHTPNPLMLMGLTVAPPRAPIVVTHHSDVIRQKIARHLMAPFQWALYHRAVLILSTSPIYIDGSAVLQSVPDKVESLPLGLDLARFARPNRRAVEIAEELKRVGALWLCVGRLVYYKGLDVAIRALAQVPGKLLIIGVGPLEVELKALAASVGVADRVIWKGHADDDDLVGAYLAATAFWFPSNARSEGFGLVQVEAMASGCPVINTSIRGSGVAWVSLHEQTGLTVAVNDHAALALAAKRLLEDRELRDRLAAAARRRAHEEFDQRVMAQRSVAFYEKAIRQSQASVPRQGKWPFARRTESVPEGAD